MGKPKSEDGPRAAQYRRMLGQLRLEDLLRELCLQLALQREATERVAQGLEKVGTGNLIGKALQAFARPRG